MKRYETVIGLEIHAQLKTNSKIFCPCKVDFNASPNSLTCEICLGLPGTLPVLNKKALELALRTAIALNCKVSPLSTFARKNYFYPDLPKGFQITQQKHVLARNGFVEVELENDQTKKVRIARIQLEEDAGKSIHLADNDTDIGCSLVDYNRCGTPLIEIITEPDIGSPKEARVFLNKLKTILLYLDVCDCNMEEGSLRCDSNISLRLKEDWTRTQLKLLLEARKEFKGLKRKSKNEFGKFLFIQLANLPDDVKNEFWNYLGAYYNRTPSHIKAKMENLITKWVNSNYRSRVMDYLNGIISCGKKLIANEFQIEELLKEIQDAKDINSTHYMGTLRTANHIVKYGLRKPQKLGTKTELKNLNSFKNIQKALEYEEQRQIEILENSGVIHEDTLTYDDSTGTTRSVRSKEQSHDYRYFPEPDLVKVTVDEEYFDTIKKSLPELPDAKKSRFIKVYNLSLYDASVLTSSRNLSNYFEETINLHNNPKKICNWITTELLATMDDVDIQIMECKLKPRNLADMVRLIEEGKISGKIAKQIFPELLSTGKTPEDILKETGMVMISDESEIDIIVKEVIKENPELVEQIRNGKDRVLGFLVGQVMKKSKGQANPGIVNKLIKEQING